MAGERYSDEDVQEILQVAAERSFVGGLDRVKLEMAAAELGIPAESIHEAEQIVLQRKQERERFARFSKARWSSFYTHLATYVAVNGGIMVMFKGLPSWQWFMLGGWGIGLVSDLVKTIVATRPGSHEFEVWKRLEQGGAVLSANIHKTDIDLVLADFIGQGGLRDRLAAAQHLRERTGMSAGAALEAVDEFREKHPGVLA